MATNNIILNGQTFNKSDTFNPNTSDLKTDGLSVQCFSQNDNSKVNDCIIDGQDARWGAKASLTFGLEYNRCTFKNGTARSFDMVRGGNVVFKDCVFENTVRKPVASQFTIAEQCDIGIKGGVHDVTFDNCVFNDILLGDYSIYDQQDRPKTRRFTFINCCRKRCKSCCIDTWTEPICTSKISGVALMGPDNACLMSANTWSTLSVVCGPNTWANFSVSIRLAKGKPTTANEIEAGMEALSFCMDFAARWSFNMDCN